MAIFSSVTSDLINLALKEDIGGGDVTSEYFIPEGQISSAYIYAKAEGYLAGIDIASEVFRRVDEGIKIKTLASDGVALKYGDHVLEIEGDSRSILTAERTALNFLQRLSGVATNTSRYVKLTKGTQAKILDTRKTTPGWRGYMIVLW